MKSKSKLQIIKETLQQEQWQALDFVRGTGQITFAPEITIDPERAKDWTLNITVVPNQVNNEHSHYFLAEEDIIRLHDYLGKLRQHLAGLK